MNVGGHARRVVVRRLEPADVLHEVEAEQQVVAGLDSVARRSFRKRARSSGAKLPIVPPRNATSLRPPSGMSLEMAVEVADDGVHIECGILAPRCVVRRRAAICSLTSKGTNRLSVTAATQRVEQEAGLLRRPRPELDERVRAA